jgi:pimeloyl-ACP methyl ester carboxylesterase
MGHDLGQHKRHPGIDYYAHRFVTRCGIAVAAIDAPGHGDRPTTTQDAGERAAQAVPEWQATIDALLAGGHVSGPVGFWGMSMGGAIGIHLTAAEPRIVAAVVGLVGHPHLATAAAEITAPVEFVVQWDDELVPRDAALAVFDAFGSGEKTLHANPGEHDRTPRFEMHSAEQFFTRHLVAELLG